MHGHLTLVDAGAEAARWMEQPRGVVPCPDSRSAAAGHPEPAAANSRDLFLLVLGPEERCALIRALVVVKENWWLDPVEESMLERLYTLEHEPVA
jgi:hypothetical protein